MEFAMKREVIAEKVAYSIIDLIIEQSLKEGDKLPSERELSSVFSVGRPAVREALRALHMMNIVNIRHGDGIYVSSLEPTNLINPFKIYMKLGKISIDQLFETRIVLEVSGIGLAAKRITDEQLEEVDKLLAESKESIHDMQKFMDTDTRLHSLIFDAVNNPLLKSTMLSIKELTKKSREATSGFLATREMVYNDHEKIVEALKLRDENLCKERMETHLLNIKRIAHINEELYKSKILELLNDNY
ncbi:MAG: FadR/GntR family transcriptional regulator [Bacillota bacterium]|nr:FadR/GntR family transcriptional regulator [Bacillota bacterium]